MQRSTQRILTTHTGSLPRPEALTQLYVQRSRGEPVDQAEIERIGRDAVREVVAKQRDAGIDIGNNGEQQRDSFFLYLRARLSGLGGSWTRPTRGDVDRYPEFQKLWARQYGGTVGVSNLMGIPKAIGEVNYLDDTAINDECRHFKSVLDDTPDAFAEPFMCAPSPGIVALACKQRALRHARRLSRRARPRLAGRIRGDREARLSAADRRARPRAGAAHHLQGPAGVGVPGIRREDHRHHQRCARQRAARPGPPARLLGQFGIAARPRRAARGHPADPAEGQGRRLRAAVRQSAPRPRVQAVQARCRWTATRSWSPA